MFGIVGVCRGGLRIDESVMSCRKKRTDLCRNIIRPRNNGPYGTDKTGFCLNAVIVVVVRGIGGERDGDEDMGEGCSGKGLVVSGGRCVKVPVKMSSHQIPKAGRNWPARRIGQQRRQLAQGARIMGQACRGASCMDQHGQDPLQPAKKGKTECLVCEARKSRLARKGLMSVL